MQARHLAFTASFWQVCASNDPIKTKNKLL